VFRPLFLLIVAILLLSSMPAAAVAQNESTAAGSATPETTAIAGEIPDLTGTKPLSLDAARQETLTAFVVDAMGTCPVPGASVAVVQDGEVVYLAGFGVREAGGAGAVTPDTLMRIGSVTKSVTATLAASLVDDGLLAWDTPVVELLPAFTLSDPVLAERITVADLFSAAVGLPRRDLEFIFESDEYSPQGLLGAVAMLPLTAPLGERYQYSNQAYAIGGYALASAAGATPDDLLAGYQAAIRHYVLNPIGMERSTFDLAAVLESGDYAVPHAPDLAGTPRPISLLMEDRFTTAVAPAGAMWSTARELAQYLQMQLAEGRGPDGGEVVSAGNLRRTWQPGVAVPPNPQLPPLVNVGLAHYGLGWFVGEFGGLTLINHSGGTFGFSSEVAFLPAANLGVAVLANDPICGALLAYAVQYRLFELVFDLEPVVADEFSLFAGAISAQRGTARLLLDEVDAQSAASLLGSFTHPDLGEITVRFHDGALIVDAGEIWSRLVPLRGLPGQQVRYVALDPPLAGAPGWFTFEPDPEGRPLPVLTVTLVPGEAPLVYRFSPISR
jgi:CubicO group peptidase (beta-lactamase class C family)